MKWAFAITILLCVNFLLNHTADFHENLSGYFTNGEHPQRFLDANLTRKPEWQMFFLQNETVFFQVRTEVFARIEHRVLSIMEDFKRCRFCISSRARSGRSIVNLMLFRRVILTACVRIHGGFLYLII